MNVESGEIKIMKLIRDKLITVINHNRLDYANPQQYKKLLILKLKEEIKELEDSNYTDPCEYGDVVEVLFALADEFIPSGKLAIEEARLTKLKSNGGFRSGIILKY